MQGKWKEPSSLLSPLLASPATTHLFYRRLSFLRFAKGTAVLVQLGQHGFLLLQTLLELGLGDGPVRKDMVRKDSQKGLGPSTIADILTLHNSSLIFPTEK